ncbi:MAG: class I SAM-dependent methyltransferase [Thermodesulfobacteriota bacterium]
MTGPEREPETAAQAGIRPRWYDGPLYAWFYDPLERPHKAAIASLIPAGASVLDLACGTGALCLTLAPKVSRVLGVDASPRMLAQARRLAAKRGAENVSFTLAHAASLSLTISEPFDYAVFSLFFHEVDDETRLAALSQSAALCSRIVLSDFSCPQPRNIVGAFNTAVERVVGGAGNYRLFRDFQGRGGVSGLARRLDLPVERFFRDPAGARDFLVVRGRK